MYSTIYRKFVPARRENELRASPLVFGKGKLRAREPTRLNFKVRWRVSQSCLHTVMATQFDRIYHEHSPDVGST